MRNFKTTNCIKTLVFIFIACFTVSNAMAQNRSVTVKVNYLPVIVPNTPNTAPKTYDVCQHLTLNLKTLYVQEVDTNGTALADSVYTLVFSTASDFSTPITTPNYSYMLTTATQTIYAKVTMNNATACVNDTFSFVLNAKPTPAFITTNIATCYGVNVDLATAVTAANLTNGGATPLREFSLDSATFTPIATSATYDATLLGSSNGGNYKLYARVQNTDALSGCYSVIVPFMLHVDTMPTLVVSASANNTEICDSTSLNLGSFITSTSPTTGVTLEFSINDSTFTTPLSGTSATNYLVALNNTTQQTVTVHARAKMNSTSCVSVGTAVQKFNILVNPMPRVTLIVGANGSKVCDSTTIDLRAYISDSTAGSTLEFSTINTFGTIIPNPSTYYIAVAGAPQNVQFFVRAKMTNTSCVTKGDSVKNFTLNVNPAPVTQTIIAGLANGCSNNTITYSIPSQSGITYVWSATGGTIQGSGTANQDSVLWGVANAGAKVEVVYTSTTGGQVCSKTATQNVEVLQSPTDVNLVVTGSPETCDDGGTNQIQLQVTVTDGTPAFVIDYSWSPNSGNSTVTTTGVSNSATFMVTPPNKGINYTYIINKITDSKGCILKW